MGESVSKSVSRSVIRSVPGAVIRSWNPEIGLPFTGLGLGFYRKPYIPQYPKHNIPNFNIPDMRLDRQIPFVAPTYTPSESKGQVEGIQLEETSPKWKESLREKVREKIKKINPIETKGNLYMIYGHIINLSDDEEYYINYAA